MKTKKRRSQKQERSVAKDFDARTTVASGALWGQKGDVRSSKLLVECKTTKKDYYPVTAKVWEKIAEEATQDHIRIPLLVVDLEDSYRLVVFRPKDFATPLKTPYDCTSNGDNQKSFRITLKELEDAEKDFEGYVYARLFMICGKRRNLLCFMREKDFIENYKEEI